jgi:hypothetical protein
MSAKGLTVGGAITVCAAGIAILLRESVGWLVGKALDHLPLPRGADGAVNWDAVPWLNTLAFALLALGVFLFYRGGRMQAADIVQPNPYPALGADAAAVSHNITTFRATRPIFQDRLPPLLPMLHEGVALLVSFEKNGFSVPRIQSTQGERVAVGMEHYFTVMAPMLRAGHIDEAKNLSASLAEAAQQRAADFQPNQWWTSRDL